MSVLRLSLLFLLFLSGLMAQQPVIAFGNATYGWGWFGPRKVFAGHKSYWEFTPHWAVPITCSATTSRCESYPYVPTGTETISMFGSDVGGVFLTASEMPEGLRSQYGGEKATYSVCEINNASFSLHRGFRIPIFVTKGSRTVTAAGLAPDFGENLSVNGGVFIDGTAYTIAALNSATELTLTSAYSGDSGLKMFNSSCAGKQETFHTNGAEVKMLFDPGTPLSLVSVTGFPEGTKLTYKSTEPGGISVDWPFRPNGAVQFYQGRGTLTLIADIPASTSPGSYVVSLTTAEKPTGDGAASTFNLPVEVVDFFPVSNTTPSEFPPIPKIEEWESTMVANGSSGEGGGSFWCNKSNGTTNPSTLSFGNESEIWYYDGARVYSRIADYTGDPLWNNCRNSIAEQYKAYLSPNKSNVPGYRVFPHGLGIMYQSGDNSYKQVLEDFTKQTGTLFAYYGGRVSDIRIRETAYAGDVYYVLSNVLGSTEAQRDTNADLSISNLMAWCSGGPYGVRIWFQAALAAESLIQYHSLTGDERVPWVIRCLTEAMDANYNKSTHVLPYAADADGPYCNNHQSWYALDVIGRCNDGDYTANRVLNLLIAPIYAWYWQYTASPDALRQGDELWTYGVETGVPYGGKSFSQQYRWSFDYVAWRSLGGGIKTPQSTKNRAWQRWIRR